MSIIIEGHLTPSRLQRLAMASMLALALAIPAMAADTDNDGLEDSIETEYGLTVGVTTCAVYLDAVNGDDTNSGLAPSDAKRTFAGALAVQRNAPAENVILVAPGVYSGTQNRNLDFMGDDIIIRSTMGAQDTIVDLGARDGSSTSTMAKPWLAASTDSRYETDTPPRTARQCAWRMHRWTSGTAYLRITDPDDSCDMNTRKDASKNTGRMQCRQPQSMRREEQYSPQTASSTETPPNPRTPVSTMTIT